MRTSPRQLFLLAAWLPLLAGVGCKGGDNCTPGTFRCASDENAPHGRLSEACGYVDSQSSDETKWYKLFCYGLGDGGGPFNCQSQRDTTVCADGLCYCRQ